MASASQADLGGFDSRLLLQSPSLTGRFFSQKTARFGRGRCAAAEHRVCGRRLSRLTGVELTKQNMQESPIGMASASQADLGGFDSRLLLQSPSLTGRFFSQKTARFGRGRCAAAERRAAGAGSPVSCSNRLPLREGFFSQKTAGFGRGRCAAAEHRAAGTGSPVSCSNSLPLREGRFLSSPRQKNLRLFGLVVRHTERHPSFIPPKAADLRDR